MRRIVIALILGAAVGATATNAFLARSSLDGVDHAVVWSTLKD